MVFIIFIYETEKHTMKTCILIVILIIHASYCLPEPGPARSDADVCAALLTQAAESKLPHHDFLSGKTVRLAYSGRFRLSSFARSVFEAYLTSLGCRITSGYRADYTIELTVTDSSIVLIRKKILFERSITLAVHFTCSDPTNTVVLASGSVETSHDSLTKNHLRQTDNGQQFSRDSRRIIVEKDHKKMMIITLLIITGSLAYFSSQ